MSVAPTFSSPTLLNPAYLPAKMNALALNSSGVYVAVGNSGKFMTSTDGISWGTPALMGGSSSSANMNAVITNGATFIAVGTDSVTGNAVYATSSNGLSWPTAPTAMSGTATVATMTSVVYSNSLYVAVGYNASNYPMFSTSADGSSWSVPDVVASYSAYARLLSVTANSSGIFIAVGTDGTYPLYARYDSTVPSWDIQPTSLSDGSNGFLNSITLSASGRFMAVGGDGSGYPVYTTSTDGGGTWSSPTLITTSPATMTSITVTSLDFFVAIGYDSTNNYPVKAYYDTLNGWSGPTAIHSVIGIMKSIVLDGTGSGFVVIGNDTSDNAVYTRSTDGNSWNNIATMISAVAINSLITDSAGLIVGVGQDVANGYPIYTTSSNGYSWNIPVVMDNTNMVNMTSVAVDATRTLYMAVGTSNSGYPMYSLTNVAQDITSWSVPSQLPMSSTASLRSVCYVNYVSGPLFVAVGDDGSQPVFATYDINTTSWTGPTSFPNSNGGQMNSVAVNSAGRLVAVGTGNSGYPIFSTSTDGASWSDPAIINGAAEGTMNSVAVDSAGTGFVAVGNNSSNYPIFARSTNGTSWTTPALMGTLNQAIIMKSVVASSRGIFMAVGYGNSTYPMYSSSSNGYVWTDPVVVNNYTNTPSQFLSVTVKFSGLFVGVGNNSNGFPIYSTAIANAPCFLEGTTILCQVDEKEVYVPIEKIVPGTLVKTRLSGYKKVKLIGKRNLENSGTDERTDNRLYKCSTKNYPELKEDLYITGGHSILVGSLTDKQRSELVKSLTRVFVTEKQYRLTASLDERAEPWVSEGTYVIWHLALESESDATNYGVYANGGLLVETASIKCMLERAKMELQ